MSDWPYKFDDEVLPGDGAALHGRTLGKDDCVVGGLDARYRQLEARAEKAEAERDEAQSALLKADLDVRKAEAERDRLADAISSALENWKRPGVPLALIALDLEEALSDSKGSE